MVATPSILCYHSFTARNSADNKKGQIIMPRTKGSKNKAKLSIDEQITQTTARVEELKAALEAAEAELHNLTALRDEEAMKELMAAIASSGKSVADVVAMLKEG